MSFMVSPWRGASQFPCARAPERAVLEIQRNTGVDSPKVSTPLLTDAWSRTRAPTLERSRVARALAQETDARRHYLPFVRSSPTPPLDARRTLRHRSAASLRLRERRDALSAGQP